MIRFYGNEFFRWNCASIFKLNKIKTKIQADFSNDDIPSYLFSSTFSLTYIREWFPGFSKTPLKIRIHFCFEFPNGKLLTKIEVIFLCCFSPLGKLLTKSKVIFVRCFSPLWKFLTNFHSVRSCPYYFSLQKFRPIHVTSLVHVSHIRVFPSECPYFFHTYFQSRVTSTCF